MGSELGKFLPQAQESKILLLGLQGQAMTLDIKILLTVYVKNLDICLELLMILALW